MLNLTVTEGGGGGGGENKFAKRRPKPEMDQT
jgi:hypothetical protein